jgi:hypothetical protein
VLCPQTGKLILGRQLILGTDKYVRRAEQCGVQDPSVMAATLCALHDMIAVDAAPYKNLVPSFVNILKQVCPHACLA